MVGTDANELAWMVGGSPRASAIRGLQRSNFHLAYLPGCLIYIPESRSKRNEYVALDAWKW